MLFVFANILKSYYQRYLLSYCLPKTILKKACAYIYCAILLFFPEIQVGLWKSLKGI